MNEFENQELGAVSLQLNESEVRLGRGGIDAKIFREIR